MRLFPFCDGSSHSAAEVTLLLYLVPVSVFQAARLRLEDEAKVSSKEPCFVKGVVGQPGYSMFHDCQESGRCYWTGQSCLPKCDARENQNVANCLNQGFSKCSWNEIDQTCMSNAPDSPGVENEKHANATKEPCFTKSVKAQADYKWLHDCSKSDRCYWDGKTCLPRCELADNQNSMNCLNGGTSICAWDEVASSCSRKLPLKPVIIIPGDGSNQLEARFNKESKPAWYCDSKSDWHRVWLKTSSLLLSTTCWADTIKLLYDQQRDTLSNNVGVETRVPGFGDTSGIEELDPSVPGHATAAFYHIVEALVAAGYQRGVTVRGAPYDFRFAPSSPIGLQYIDDLRNLIEETVRTQGRRVTLLSHSMGGLQTLYLLRQQSQAWKDKFVEKWIPIAAPWAGAAKIFHLHASGDSQGLPVNPLTIREEQRSYETNFWLAPVPKWFGDTRIITTSHRDYSAQDYASFFSDIGYAAGNQLYQRTAELTSTVSAPGVEVLCLYSLGVDTPELFDYGNKGFDVQPAISYGDGDGTVNSISLKLCERWASSDEQLQSVEIKQFSGITHSGMLSDPDVIADLMHALGLANSTTGRD